MKEQLKNKENKLKILPLLVEKDMNTSSKILEETKFISLINFIYVHIYKFVN